MHTPRTPPSQTTRLGLLARGTLLLWAPIAVAGCELIVDFDRSKLDDEDNGGLVLDAGPRDGGGDDDLDASLRDAGEADAGDRPDAGDNGEPGDSGMEDASVDDASMDDASMDDASMDDAG